MLTWLRLRFFRPWAELAERATRLAGGTSSARGSFAQIDWALGRLARELQDSRSVLAAEREKLGGILTSLAEGLIAIDRDERVLHLNERAIGLLEIQTPEPLGKPLWEITRLPELAETASAAMAENQGVDRSVIKPGARDRVLELRATPLRIAGQVRGAVVIIDDVTQLRSLETMRRDFVGNVSHELKTPLTAIRGLVETLLDDPETAPETRGRFLEKTLRQAERMSLLVSDLLSLSRLESGDALERSPLDLRAPVAASVRALQPTSEAKNIQVVIKMPQRALWIDGDEEALRQAVTNLLDNALKYSPEGAAVTVEVGEKANRAQIAVSDQGPGIERHLQERIFERFFRVDKARSRELGGTGLGLAIVKHVAQAHGGEVELESAPGRGSTFSILVPRRAESETQGGIADF